MSVCDCRSWTRNSSRAARSFFSVSTLAGDLATLRRLYEVKLDGGEREWRLTLKPGDPQMQEVVREIRIGGSGDTIASIEFMEANGDRSVMTITRDGP